MTKTQTNIPLLLEGCRCENRESQRQLYAHFFGFGMSICLRYSRHRDEALEIFNDAFLKVFLRLDQYDSAFSIEGWLRTIFVRTAIDYHRRHHRFPEFVGLQNLPDLPADDAPLPRLSLDEDVLPILQKLTPAYRVVFNLAVIEELSHLEIAEILGITPSASRSNLARAKQQLLAIFSSEKGNSEMTPKTLKTSLR